MRNRLASSVARFVIALLAVVALGTSADAASGALPSPLWGALEPGPYAVGFQVLERRDPARPFRHPLDLDGKPRNVDVARPLQIGVWYPAKDGAGATMRLGDYVALMGGEQDFSLSADERARRGETAYSETFASSANVWDSLADGYEATGAPAKAVEASKKALELLARDNETPETRKTAIRQSAEGRLARLQAGDSTP